MSPFRTAQTGGVFSNGPHAGHRELLRTGFDNAMFMYICVVTDDSKWLRKKFLSEFIQPYHERVGTLKAWLDIEYKGRYEIVPLHDLYAEEVILLPELEASIICHKTLTHFDNINRIREEHGLKPLDIIMSPSFNRGVSSTLIRKYIYREKYGRWPDGS